MSTRIDPEVFTHQLMFALGSGAGPMFPVSPKVVEYVRDWVLGRASQLDIDSCRALIMAAPAAAAAATRAVPGTVFSIECVQLAQTGA